jgi:cytochrome c oxidase cbb3-type subunit 3/ubiquinol-cytochrome c reductase cytochrome c subunit
VACCLLTGCKNLPGYPKPAWQPPQDEMNFQALYKTNCAACHGENGRNGIAIPMANPEYLALVDDGTLRKVISGGMPGTLMPAFANKDGGTLTDRQVDAIIAGMRKAWGEPNALGGVTPPAYAQPLTGGNAEQGRQDYITYCVSCHESSHESLTNSSYLALVSDQTLRSIIIAGRPDLKQPDWRNDKPGHPLTDQEVTDIVAYLGSLRVASPGQPYPSQP